MSVDGVDGQSVIGDELLLNSPDGLIDQSLHSGLGVETTNEDASGRAGTARAKGQTSLTRRRSGAIS